MVNNRQKLIIEELSQDESFIRWVKTGDDSKKWELFVQENPTYSKNIEIAKQIVSSLSIKSSKPEEDEMYSVWKRIERYYTLKQPVSTKLRFLKFAKYAAVFLLVLVVGVGAYKYFRYNEDRFAQIDLMTKDLTEAKLILADGGEVLLKQEESDLKFNKTGTQVKIDKDTIVTTTGASRNNALAQVIIPYGKRSKVLLSDGTIIWMNAGSRLLFPQKFEGKQRKVYLKGEAYFEVARDELHPFVVSTSNINVTVLGTEFNLCDNVSDNEIEVVLVKGEISLKENSLLNVLKEEVKLKPNQKAVFDKVKNTTSVESDIDTKYYTSWKEGLLIFNHASILSVLKRLSRYYNVQFVVERSVELNSGFTGKLDLKESLNDVLKVVSDAAPINSRIEDDKIYITQKIPFLPMK